MAVGLILTSTLTRRCTCCSMPPPAATCAACVPIVAGSMPALTAIDMRFHVGGWSAYIDLTFLSSRGDKALCAMQSGSSSHQGRARALPCSSLAPRPHVLRPVSHHASRRPQPLHGWSPHRSRCCEFGCAPRSVLQSPSGRRNACGMWEKPIWCGKLRACVTDSCHAILCLRCGAEASGTRTRCCPMTALWSCVLHLSHPPPYCCQASHKKLLNKFLVKLFINVFLDIIYK